MRILLASISALALLSTAVRGQGDVSFDIDFNPPGGDDPTVLWESPDGPGGTLRVLEDFRIRVKGTEGTWVRPVLNFSVAATAPDGFAGIYTWMEQNVADGTGGGLSLPMNGSHQITVAPNYTNTVIPNVASFERWINTMLQGQTPGYSPSAVKAWAQPFVRPNGSTGPLAQTTRVWTASTPFWQTQPEGLHHGLFWRAIIHDPTSSKTFNAFSALRLAVVEHALNTPNVTLQDVGNYFRSTKWTSALEDGHLNLAIQLAAASATNFAPNPVFPTDPDVPDLTESALIPSLSIGTSSKFVVAVGPQVLGGPTDIGSQPAVPGQRLFFSLPSGRGPTKVAYKDVNGNHLEGDAFAFPLKFAPSLYGTFVPFNAVSGPVGIKTGSMTVFEDVGVIQIP